MAYLAVAGAVISAVSAVQQGQARSQEASYQAQVARNNAQIADQNARYAVAAGTEKATQQSLKGAAVQGRIKSALAANNVDVNSGSAVDVEESAARSSQLDTETEMHGGLLKAYGYRVAAQGDEAQARLLENEADQAPIGAGLGAAGSLLENASSLGFKWSRSQSAYP